MKIRQGFVSNSSSSSFIIFFDKKPESAEEMKAILFGDRETFTGIYEESYYPTIEVAETVFNDIKDQSPLTKEQISEELDNGWVEGAPEFSSFRTDSSNMRKDFDKYTRARKVFSDKTAEELISSAFGKLPFCVEYSDDSTYGSSLEHGDLFNNITNFRISKH